jgi:hypothetical protein
MRVVTTNYPKYGYEFVRTHETPGDHKRELTTTGGLSVLAV